MFASFDLIPHANRSNSQLDPINDGLTESDLFNIVESFDEIMQQDEDVEISSPVNNENQRQLGFTMYSDMEIA